MKNIKVTLLTLSIFLLTLSLASTFSGCGPGYPPNYLIICPQVTFDGQGNLFTAYQYNNGNGAVTYVQKLDKEGKVLWNVNLDSKLPEPQSRKNPKFSTTRILSDEQGNVVILWVYKNEILAKKLDGNGNPIWKEESIKIGIVNRYQEMKILNNPKGIVILWTDADYYLNIQTIDNDGNILWSLNKCAIKVSGFAALCDNQGNTRIISGRYDDKSVRLQTIDVLGQLRSTALELQTASSTVSDSEWERPAFWIMDDGSGNIIAGWQGFYLRKIDADDTILWSINASYAKDGTTLGLTSEIVSDGKGGVFAVWLTPSASAIFVSHIDSQGAAKWDSRGIEVVSDSSFVQKTATAPLYTMNTDNSGGVIITWESAVNRQYQFLAQRIDPDGNKLWGENGIVLGALFSGSMLDNININSDSLQETYVSYGVLDGGLGASFIQRIDPDGNLPWGVEGLRLQ